MLIIINVEINLPVFFPPFIADETISSLWEKSITLTCPFDVTSCGELHSIKWTRGRETIAVVSGDGQVVNVNPSYESR